MSDDTNSAAFRIIFPESSSNTVVSSDSAIIKFSLQTTEFDDFGNRFSITVFLPDQSSVPLKSINLTF